MEVAVYKDYNEDGVNMLIASDEILSMGLSVTDVATRDIPGPVTVPEVAEDKQALIKEGDIPDADGNFVMRYDEVTQSYQQLLDEDGNPIAVTGSITYSHNFLVLDDSTLPTDRFFSAWEIDSALLVSGSGTADVGYPSVPPTQQSGDDYAE